MQNSAIKAPLVRSLNKFAERKVLDAINIRGMALPCHVVGVSGSIVKVSFDVQSDFTLPEVTIPSWGYEYIRFPVQTGDKGMVMPSDVSLGNASGLGSGGIPALSDIPATMSALVFVPLANAKWSDSDDPNAVVIYGPNGVVLRDKDKNTTVTINQSGTEVDSDLTVTGVSSLGGAGGKAIAVTGDTVIGGKVVASTLKAKAK